MNEAPQLASTILVIAFAATMITVGQWYVQSRSPTFAVLPVARADVRPPLWIGQINKKPVQVRSNDAARLPELGF